MNSIKHKIKYSFLSLSLSFLLLLIHWFLSKSHVFRLISMIQYVICEIYFLWNLCGLCLFVDRFTSGLDNVNLNHKISSPKLVQVVKKNIEIWHHFFLLQKSHFVYWLSHLIIIRQLINQQLNFTSSQERKKRIGFNIYKFVWNVWTKFKFKFNFRIYNHMLLNNQIVGNKSKPLHQRFIMAVCWHFKNKTD